MRVRISLLSAIAFLAFAASAQAQVVVGQLAPSATKVTCGGAYDEWQTSVASGASYVVPAPGGVITSWRTNAGTATTQRMGFKVFRPTGAGTYTVAGLDGTRLLTPSVLNTFAVDIPVQTGDIIGINLPALSDAACFFSGTEGDEIAYTEGDAAVGSTIPPENAEGGVRVNVSATLLPPPTVSAILSGSGSIKGGTSVAITGSNFAEVKSVTYGTTAATSFTVDSEGQITAIAPPSTTLSTVPISVTTIAGTASSPTTFTYEGCNVPKLNGKKLKAAKKKLKAADCELGRVKKLEGATSKTGKVKSQSPKPGKVLAPGSKVNVKLG